jgi:hypothetical protein
MEPWPLFPQSFSSFPTNEQPQAYQYGSNRWPALHNVESAQPAVNQPEVFHLPNPPQKPVISAPQDTISLDNAELTAAPMAPPPKRRKKKAPTLRAKDWEPYKNRILELHITQKLALPKVKTMIEEEFNFTAEYDPTIICKIKHQLTAFKSTPVSNPYNSMGKGQKRQARRDGCDCQEAAAEEA